MIPRRFPRHQQRLMGVYWFPSGTIKHELNTATLNISEDGCTLLTGDRTEPSRTTVAIGLVLPSREKVELSGHIIWSKPPQVSPTGTLIVPGTIGVQYAGEVPPVVPPEYKALLAKLAAGALAR